MAAKPISVVVVGDLRDKCTALPRSNLTTGWRKKTQKAGGRGQGIRPRLSVLDGEDKVGGGRAGCRVDEKSKEQKGKEKKEEKKKRKQKEKKKKPRPLKKGRKGLKGSKGTKGARKSKTTSRREAERGKGGSGNERQGHEQGK